MPIPALVDQGDGSPALLPPGEHEASLDEIRQAFGSSFRRRELLDHMETIVTQLFEEGAVRIWLDGSFVTGKRNPGDTDLVYEVPAGFDTSKWDLMQDHLKKQRRIHLFLYPYPVKKPGVWHTGSARPITEYFKSTEDGTEKGIIVVRRPA